MSSEHSIARRKATHRQPAPDATVERAGPTQAGEALGHMPGGALLEHPTAGGMLRRSLALLQRTHGNQAVQRMGALPTSTARGAAVQRDISTPLPANTPIARDGSATVTVAQVRVRLLPDRRTRSRRMANRAETKGRIRWGTPGYRTDRNRIVTHVNPLPPVTMSIQTTYGPRVTAQSSSAYGRGTTPDDVQAGNTNLGFHEGSHGTDFMDYLNANPLPAFTGAVGMSRADYLQAVADYNQAMRDYQRQMDEYSEQHTDCVGTPAGFCPAP